MLFNSIEFLIFLPITFSLYWLATNKRILFQNALLLVFSYFFYASWNWKFLFLLIFSTLLDYFTGLKIAAAPTHYTKKVWLCLSIFINLGLLVVLKYYNFLLSIFTQIGDLTDLTIHATSLQIILPIGISFYTFHGLSYIIDIYNNKIIPEKKFINYALYVSFFPLLVAGPIERATHLLPQIIKKRTFDKTKMLEGLQQILWGFFKKVVIADQCATIVNPIFQHYSSYSGSMLVLGAVLFTFQIYGDFSGYSDIALGVAKLFGIELMQNFAFPLFSTKFRHYFHPMECTNSL